MSFDAPLPPATLVPDRDRGMSPAAPTDEAIRSLVSSGLDHLLRRREGCVAYEHGKRIIELWLSTVAVVVLLPVFALVAILVRWSSPGPVLFRQRRLGRHGRVFWCYKFRTMVEDAEERLQRCAELAQRYQENFKIKEDPRVTRIGAFLRKTSLDELPQLVNVLRGEISLIGPRPIVEPELAKYGVHAEKLLSVKPGVSGLWQVRRCADTTYAERIAMDMTYIDNRSLWLDLKLIVLTVIVVLRGRGAY
jgi:lipopolysaccharide/colanic/teichoic acid biosynthesis glycosyltransferase